MRQLIVGLNKIYQKENKHFAKCSGTVLVYR